MEELGCLPLNSRHDFRMAVARCDHGYACGEVEKDIAINVFNQSSTAATCNQGIAARVRGRDVAVVEVDHPLGIGSGKRSNQARQLRFRRVSLQGDSFAIGGLYTRFESAAPGRKAAIHTVANCLRLGGLGGLSALNERFRARYLRFQRTIPSLLSSRMTPRFARSWRI